LAEWDRVAYVRRGREGEVDVDVDVDVEDTDTVRSLHRDLDLDLDLNVLSPSFLPPIHPAHPVHPPPPTNALKPFPTSLFSSSVHAAGFPIAISTTAIGRA
jgi:hypothetical protein